MCKGPVVSVVTAQGKQEGGLSLESVVGVGRSSGQRWQGSPSHLRVVTFIHTCMHAKLLQLYLTLCDLWTVACQAPRSMRFSRQEYWSG